MNFTPKPFFCASFLLCLFFLFLPSASLAGIEHLGSMYGIFPADIALAGARSEGVAEAAAAYHNPAALADLPFSALTVSYLYAWPALKGGQKGKQENFHDANSIVGLGVGLDVGKFFSREYPVGMGLNLLMDETFGQIVTFDHKYNDNGKWIRYGTRSLSLFHGLGFRVVKGLNIGAGYSLTYTASVDLIQDVEVTGSTENEQISLVGQPVLAPIAAVQVITEPVTIGLVYRARHSALVDPVTGETTGKIGGVTILDYPNSMSFKDGFVPHQFVLGIGLFPKAVLNGTIQGEYHRWEDLNDAIYSSTDEERDLDFDARDTFVPRTGISWQAHENWAVRGGYAFEQSPFSRLGSGYYKVLDNDRHRITAGAGFHRKFGAVRFPLAIDAALIYYPLMPREVIAKDHLTLQSSGYLLGGALSVTVGF